MPAGGRPILTPAGSRSRRGGPIRPDVPGDPPASRVTIGRMQRFSIPGQGGHLSALNFGRARGPIDLVFLHATGFCAQVYRHLIDRLGPDRRTVALDLRGHGHTTLPAHPFRLTGWDVHARDVAAAIRHLRRDGDLPPPRLIAGHSMGGASALLALGRDSSAAPPRGRGSRRGAFRHCARWGCGCASGAARTAAASGG